MIFNKHTAKQNIIVFSIIVGVLFLTSLPYMVGLFLANGDVYLGGNYLNQGDLHVYLSNIEQVKNGKLLTANNFTSETQKDIFFAPLWLLLGWLARFLQINSLLIFHLARVIAGFIFLIFLFYYFLDIFFSKFFNKLVAFILICFSSGLGFFFKPRVEGIITDDRIIFNNFAIDLIMPEANVFLSLAHSALFIFSQLIILLIFYLVLKKEFKQRDLLYLFCSGCLLGFLHTYDIIIVAAVLTVYFFVQLAFFALKGLKFSWQKYLHKYTAVLISFLPALAYWFFILKPEPTIWGWVEQNIILSSPVRGYIIGYLPVIVFCLISLYLIRHKLLNKKIIFLLCWIIILFILVYLPFAWQRKLISTVQIALAILGTYGALAIIRYFLKIYQAKILNIIVIIILLVFISLSNLSFITSTIYHYQELHYIFYFPQNYWQAVNWYRDNSNDSQAILSAALNGSAIAGLTGWPVYVGHPHQTIDYKNKRDLLDNWFFKADQQDQKKKEFLQENNINYIFYSEREKFLGEYNLDNIDWLDQVYDQQNVKIYKVNY